MTPEETASFGFRVASADRVGLFLVVCRYLTGWYVGTYTTEPLATRCVLHGVELTPCRENSFARVTARSHCWYK